MTYTNRNSQRPRCLQISKPVDTVKLTIRGQGVLLFTATQTQPCSLAFCDVSGYNGLTVDFTESSVLVTLKEKTTEQQQLVDPLNTKGLVKQRGAYYWFSLDSQNQRLYAGIGEPRKETAIYSYILPSSTKLFLESFVSVTVRDLEVFSLLRDPITKSVPLLVKDTEELTMDTIASASHLPKANLSIVAQKLHDCISGKHFRLNTRDFPEFTKAIEHSIRTPGKWCYEKLKQKANEFDKDKPNEKETYLRITLGENNGESPGIPYVMEIWPVGHYSPVHNHAGASAVIRVLHGSIHVSLYPFLSEDNVEPFAKADLVKDDITWLAPAFNQVHQLKNLETNTDTCITIQCYMYKQGNTAHYDYFDYIDGNNDRQQYEPDSDMEFIEFKKLMRKEWLELQTQTYTQTHSKAWGFWC